MSKLTDQLSQNLINHRDYPLVKSVEANTWYTGRDLEEDVAALRDQFAEQKIGAGDQVLIALPNLPLSSGHHVTDRGQSFRSPASSLGESTVAYHFRVGNPDRCESVGLSD